jgi:pilus assembly protein Flp/PilA
MSNFIHNFMRDETGAAAAEYALILAIVGAGIAGAAFGLGTAIKAALGATANTITTCTANASTGC